MRSVGDGYVLNKIPHVVVLFGWQPVGSADSGVTAKVDGGQPAVQRGRRIVARNPERLELIRVRVSLYARGHQAAKCYAGFRNDPRVPNARPTQHRVARQIYFGLRSEICRIQSAGKRLAIGLVFLRPAQRPEKAVLVVHAIIDTAVTLVDILRHLRHDEKVVLRNSAKGERAIWPWE